MANKATLRQITDNISFTTLDVNSAARIIEIDVRQRRFIISFP